MKNVKLWWCVLMCLYWDTVKFTPCKLVASPSLVDEDPDVFFLFSNLCWFFFSDENDRTEVSSYFCLQMSEYYFCCKSFLFENCVQSIILVISETNIPMNCTVGYLPVLVFLPQVMSLLEMQALQGVSFLALERHCRCITTYQTW